MKPALAYRSPKSLKAGGIREPKRLNMVPRATKDRATESRLKRLPRPNSISWPETESTL